MKRAPDSPEREDIRAIPPGEMPRFGKKNGFSHFLSKPLKLHGVCPFG